MNRESMIYYYSQVSLNFSQLANFSWLTKSVTDYG